MNENNYDKPRYLVDTKHKDVLRYINKYIDHGAKIFGGYIRDKDLGKQYSDVDICINSNKMYKVTCMKLMRDYFSNDFVVIEKHDYGRTNSDIQVVHSWSNSSIHYDLIFINTSHEKYMSRIPSSSQIWYSDNRQGSTDKYREFRKTMVSEVDLDVITNDYLTKLKLKYPDIQFTCDGKKVVQKTLWGVEGSTVDELFEDTYE